MKSSLKAKRSLSCLYKGSAFALSLAAAALPVQTANASMSWTPTETKAFLTPEQLQTLAVTSHSASANEPSHIVVSLKLRNAEQLKALAQTVTQRDHPQYQKFLTPQQFLNEYAPTEEQVEKVVAYLRNNGFTDIRISNNRLLISATGTFGSVKRAFNTSLVQFEKDHRMVFANAEPAQVPEALNDSVLSVLGLQNIVRAHTMMHTGKPTQAKMLANGLARGYQPTEFPKIYNVADTPNAATTNVGIIAMGGVNQTVRDLSRFTQANHLPTVNVRKVKTGDPDGDYSDSQEGQGEWDLDSQSILGAAGGAVKQLIFYMSNNAAPDVTGLTEAFNAVVTEGTTKIINVSLGWCEEDAYTDGTMAAQDQIFVTAVAQGQTFSVASGDEGAYECNNRGFPDGNQYSVAWPASSPHVISVGGTTLYTTSSGAWANETVWNEGLDDNGKLWASTGGFSAYEPLSPWQKSLPVNPTPSGRAIPDISFDAAQNTGALIYYYGQLQQIGGTSLSAPIFAGFWARLQSANSNALGFPAASLYGAIASTPSLVHDVTSGDIGYDGYGYKAGKGWDYPTGWGSLDIAKLASYIRSHAFAK